MDRTQHAKDGGIAVNEIKGQRLHLMLGASQVRRRLKGLGFGVRKVESAGRGEAMIVHTATGQHLRELRSIFQDVLAPDKPQPSAEAPGETPAGTPGFEVASSRIRENSDVFRGARRPAESPNSHEFGYCPSKCATSKTPGAADVRSLCVFCGSSTGSDPAFRRAAETLGAALVRRDITLVYGGGNIGLMGVIADRMMADGGRVIGVIPRQLQQKELAHHGITDLHVVGSMHERKALMAELAEAFIALPGGYGTVEEFSEVLTWSQLGLHAKPMGLLNVSGYFHHFLRFLDHAVDVQLLRSEHRCLVLESDDADALLDRMNRWQAPDLPKWIDADES
jgi:uncharacterized protein (TIGR00730 family)